MKKSIRICACLQYAIDFLYYLVISCYYSCVGIAASNDVGTKRRPSSRLMHHVYVMLCLEWIRNETSSTDKSLTAKNAPSGTSIGLL